MGSTNKPTSSGWVPSSGARWDRNALVPLGLHTVNLDGAKVDTPLGLTIFGNDSYMLDVVWH